MITLLSYLKRGYLNEVRIVQDPLTSTNKLSQQEKCDDDLGGDFEEQH